MRVFLVFALLGLGNTVQAIEPCAAEKRVYESANDLIAATTVQIMELKSLLNTEQENRESILIINVKDAEARMLSTSQSLLQETELLQLLTTSRAQVDRLAAALPRLIMFSQLPEHASTAVAINQVLQAHKNSLDSEAVSDIQTLVQVIRALERTARNWRTLNGGEPVQSLDMAIEKVRLFHMNLNESVGGGPEAFAANRRRIVDTQNAVARSLAERREKEAQLADLERHMALLKQNLPKQKAALHACTRRAQFGD